MPRLPPSAMFSTPSSLRSWATVTAVVAELGVPSVKSSCVPLDSARLRANEIGLPGVPATSRALSSSSTSATTEPEPPRFAPALTVTPPPVSVPSTSSVPLLTVVPPPTLLLPVSVSDASPSLVRVPVLVPVVLMFPAYVPFVPFWLNTMALPSTTVMLPCRLVALPASVPAFTTVPPV
ncbi:hypothetical protein D3C72_1416070 [compost metagenome]